MTANWVLQILTSGVTGGIAGGLVNQGMTWWRESRAIKIKTQYERAFIAVDLIFRLERLAEQCALIVNDSGELDTNSDSDELHEVAAYPEFSIEDVKGDWRFLPVRMMYQIHELPVRIDEARRHANHVKQYDISPPKFYQFFKIRHHEFADIGLRAMYINRRLRTLCGMPESRLMGTHWSVWSVLKRMGTEARLERYRNWHKEKYAIPDDNDFRL